MESGRRKTENCRKKSPRHLRKAAETVRRSTDIVLVGCFRSLAPRRGGGANQQVHARQYSAREQFRFLCPFIVHDVDPPGSCAFCGSPSAPDPWAISRDDLLQQ